MGGALGQVVTEDDDMAAYIARRFIYSLILVVLTSLLSFLVINLPPGDYATFYLQQLEMEGTKVTQEELDNIRLMYGLDRPVYVQYFRWVGRLLQGDMGRSFRYDRPVKELIWERLPVTIGLSLMTMFVSYLIAIPIGVYSAVRQYSLGDYAFTVLSFVGVSVPDFILALVLMIFFYFAFGVSVGGLFSLEYAPAPWRQAIFSDLLKHLPLTVLIVGLSGTAGMTRNLRAMLLDELLRPYVQTARAKGLKERQLLWKYPIRLAVLPMVSTIGWSLRGIFSGSTIVSIVLNLPTVGPLLFTALRSQDMYLASSVVLILTVLTLIGTFISDVLLVWLDPRIRYIRE
jgi:peptide/nickel transport system permease protein